MVFLSFFAVVVAAFILGIIVAGLMVHGLREDIRDYQRMNREDVLIQDANAHPGPWRKERRKPYVRGLDEPIRGPRLNGDKWYPAGTRPLFDKRKPPMIEPGGAPENRHRL